MHILSRRPQVNCWWCVHLLSNPSVIPSSYSPALSPSRKGHAIPLSSKDCFDTVRKSPLGVDDALLQFDVISLPRYLPPSGPFPLMLRLCLVHFKSSPCPTAGRWTSYIAFPGGPPSPPQSFRTNLFPQGKLLIPEANTILTSCDHFCRIVSFFVGGVLFWWWVFGVVCVWFVLVGSRTFPICPFGFLSLGHLPLKRYLLMTPVKEFLNKLKCAPPVRDNPSDEFFSPILYFPRSSS